MTKVPKKILLCTSSTLPDNAGDGRSAFSFARSLKLFGQEPTVLSLNWYLVYSGKERIGKIPVYRIPYFNKNLLHKFISRLIVFPYFLFFVAKNDVIIIYGKIIAHTLLIFIGKLFGKKLIYRSTLFGFDDFNSLLDGYKKKSMLKKIYNCVHYYFSITPAFTSVCKLHFRDKMNVFESCQGVDTSVFFSVDRQQKNEIRRKLNLSEEQIIIISVGPLIKRKGYDEVFEILRGIELPFLFVIVGDNAAIQHNYPPKKVKEYDRLFEKGQAFLGGKVCFRGVQDNVDEYLQSADIFLLNSSKEGLPNVLLEAMACGVAPVIKNLSGITDYIVFQGQNAEIYCDGLGMKRSIIKLIQDDEYRRVISQASANYIKENCSLDVVTQKFVDQICGG